MLVAGITAAVTLQSNAACSARPCPDVGAARILFIWSAFLEWPSASARGASPVICFQRGAAAARAFFIQHYAAVWIAFSARRLVRIAARRQQSSSVDVAGFSAWDVLASVPIVMASALAIIAILSRQHRPAGPAPHTRRSGGRLSGVWWRYFRVVADGPSDGGSARGGRIGDALALRPALSKQRSSCTRRQQLPAAGGSASISPPYHGSWPPGRAIFSAVRGRVGRLRKGPGNVNILCSFCSAAFGSAIADVTSLGPLEIKAIDTRAIRPVQPRP